MKIAFLCESPADEAAIAVLVEGILGHPFSHANVPNYRAPGCTAIPRVLPLVLRSLYFGSDVDALVVVLDSNSETIHSESPNPSRRCDPDCRLCELRAIAAKERSRLTLRPERSPIRCAFGLAVPAIEAWLLSFRKSGMTEVNWITARKEKRPDPFSREQLKRLAYGTTRISLESESAKMKEYMTEIVTDLERFRTAFPGGFGPLYDEVRIWK